MDVFDDMMEACFDPGILRRAALALVLFTCALVPVLFIEF